MTSFLILFFLTFSGSSTFSSTSLLFSVKNSLAEQLEKKQKQKTHKKTPPARLSNKNVRKAKRLPSSGCTKELVVKSVIGPASLNSLNHALTMARKDQCSSLLLLINTPGGSLLSTRKIVEGILDSEIPILCLVHPAGAHAGSAGAIILQACHVNGAVKTTHLGAATPIVGSGKDLAKDLRKKMINDTTSWLDSLTELRKRNKKFGREIIQDAKAVNAREAYRIGAIDFFAENKEDFLLFAQDRTVMMKDSQTIKVQVGQLESIPLGLRHHFVSFITNPEMVYLLFIGSLMLIYFELTHPGTIAPGVLGAIGLIVSFIGMHKLNFVWGGLFLILLGLIFIVLEWFVTSFGVLSIAGVVSFVIGSFFLFDPSKTGGVSIPTSTIVFVSLAFSIFSLGIAYLAFGSLRKSRKREEEKWIGLEGTVTQVQTASKGLFDIKGEIWKYTSSDVLKVGDKVKILKYKSMVFTVQKQEENSL